jgi:hypothetical protein
VSEDEYLDAIRNRLGLRPGPNSEIGERYWLYLDRENQPHTVRKPYGLTPVQRRAAFEELKRQVDPFNQLQ